MYYLGIKLTTSNEEGLEDTTLAPLSAQPKQMPQSALKAMVYKFRYAQTLELWIRKRRGKQQLVSTNDGLKYMLFKISERFTKKQIQY